MSQFHAYKVTTVFLTCPRTRISCHLLPPFLQINCLTNQKVPALLPQRDLLPFWPGFPSRPACPVQKKKKKRFSGTGKIVTQLPSLPTKRSTALSTRKWLFLLHLNKTLAAVIEDPEKVHLKLKCRTTFLSVQTDFSYLEKRPVIKTNTIPFTSCSLVCAHKNRLRVEMALSNT